MSNKIINDDDLLCGVEKLEKYLKEQKEFSGIQFLLWEELQDPCLRAKLLRKNETKVITFPKKYYDSIVNFSFTEDKSTYSQSLPDDKKRLVSEALKQLDEQEWVLE